MRAVLKAALPWFSRRFIAWKCEQGLYDALFNGGSAGAGPGPGAEEGGGSAGGTGAGSAGH